LIFGFAMVVMMIWKPRGLVSSRTPTLFLGAKTTIDSALVGEGRA
jgi:branched-chain amino acid transport system permease protein